VRRSKVTRINDRTGKLLVNLGLPRRQRRSEPLHLTAKEYGILNC
jgi:hypothetical protein